MNKGKLTVRETLKASSMWSDRYGETYRVKYPAGRKATGAAKLVRAMSGLKEMQKKGREKSIPAANPGRDR